MYNAGAAANRPVDSERAMRTVHVGGIGGLGETITENDVADFFGQQGAWCRSCDNAESEAPKPRPR